MLAKEIKESELNQFEGWIAQRKEDGERCIAEIDNGIITLRNRKNADITLRYPEIVIGLAKMPVKAVLDGEITSLTEKFNDLQQRSHLSKELILLIRVKQFPCKFVAFDILEKEGRNLRNLVLGIRLKKLNELKRYESSYFKITETGKPKEMWYKAKEQGWEGIILKNDFSIYEDKRSSSWVKLKVYKEAIVKVLGYTSENREISALETEKGKVNFCFGKELSNYWISKIKAKAENIYALVSYLELTADNKMRFPILKELVIK